MKEVETKKPEQTAAVEQKSEPQPKPKPEEKKAEKPKEAAPKPEAKKPEEKPAKQKAGGDSAEEARAHRSRSATSIPTGSPRCSTRSPTRQARPRPCCPAEEPAPKKVRGQSNGTEMTMSVNEIDALRARIAQCWSPPPGGLGAEQIVVKLRMKLNEDGTLVGYPTVANSRLIAFLPGRRRQCRARGLSVPALHPAERQICAVARHDPQFRPKRHVSRGLTSTT